MHRIKKNPCCLNLKLTQAEIETEKKNLRCFPLSPLLLRWLHLLASNHHMNFLYMLSFFFFFFSLCERRMKEKKEKEKNEREEREREEKEKNERDERQREEKEKKEKKEKDKSRDYCV